MFVPEDSLAMIKILPNIIGVNKAKGLHHMDFLWARDAEIIVFNKIIESLKEYN